MNGQNMEAMMQEMQTIQVCMAKVDFNALSALQEKAFSVQKNIETMCQQGQRDQAQQKAISFSKEVMSTPAIVQLKGCSKGTVMEKMMEVRVNDFTKTHVCDGEKVEFSMPQQQRIQW